MPWLEVTRDRERALHAWLASGRTCPVDPVKVGGLRFYPPSLEIAHERNLNLFVISFGEVSDFFKKNPRSVPTNPSTRISYQNGGYIEDITEQRTTSAPSYVKERRVYRVQQPPADDGEQAPVEINCSDIISKPRNRPCDALWFQYRGLQVEYKFWPEGGVTPNISNHHDVVPGPSEPHGFLAFDARIRQWIDSLQHRPPR